MMDIDTKMLKSVSDANRHGHVIKVTRKGLSEFIIEDIDDGYMRVSYSNTDDVIMIDPSGGPYITAEYKDQPGMNMGYFDNDWEGLIIEKMFWDRNHGNILMIECYYDKTSEWEQIK